MGLGWVGELGRQNRSVMRELAGELEKKNIEEEERRKKRSQREREREREREKRKCLFNERRERSVI